MQHVDIHSIKSACTDLLNKYINSKKPSDEQTGFSAYKAAMIFQKQRPIIESLIKQVEHVSSAVGMQDLFQRNLELQDSDTQDLLATFQQCLAIIMAGIHQTPNWTFLGEGTYNSVYVNKDRTYILKIRKSYDEEASYDVDNPERSVRVWNEVNAHITPPAELRSVELSNKADPLICWVAPFIEGRQASDDEMSTALVDIFNRTGRIIVDAVSPNNFITTSNGNVVCVDIGLALQMERREEDELAQIARPRKKSQESLSAWQDLSDGFSGTSPSKPESYFDYAQRGAPNTVQTIKALLFIKEYRPDIMNVDFLHSKPQLLRQLSQAYGSSETQYCLEIIKTCVDTNPALAPSPNNQP
jgi:hypothetical protein